MKTARRLSHCSPRQSLLSIALGLGLSLGSPLAAQAELDSIFAQGKAPIEALDDESLSDLRGRFSTTSGVLEIGVDLRSVWVAADGSTLTATAGIRANAQEISSRSARITTSASATAGADRQTSATSGSSGVASAAATRSVSGAPPLADGANGLAQTVQIAGDRNQVSNQLQLDITRRAIAPTALVPLSAQEASRTSSAQATLADGSRASATIGPGGLQVALSMAGIGASQQQIGSSSVHQGILQSVRIAADAQAVANSAAIRLTLAPLSQGAMVNDHMLQALRAVQGLRR